MRIGLGLFIIAHGLVHAILAIAPNTANPDAKPGVFFTSADRSWLLPKLGLNAAPVLWVGIILVVVSTLGFVLAGLGIFGVAGLSTIGRWIIVISSLASLLLLSLFWHPWLLVGMLIDAGILIALLWLKLPLVDWVGS